MFFSDVPNRIFPTLNFEIKINYFFNMKFTLNSKSILISTVIFDVLIILLHVLFGQKYALFNIDWESNLPAIYQGLKYILTGSLFLTLVFLFNYSRKKLSRKEKIYWIGLVIIVTLMGFDEVAQVHEWVPYYFAEIFPSINEWYVNIFRSIGFGSSLWIIYLLPVVLLLPIWALIIAKSVWLKHGRKLFPLLIGFFLIFFGAFVLEFIGTTNTVYFSSWIQLVTILEELFEMLGASFILYYVIKELEQLK